MLFEFFQEKVDNVTLIIDAQSAHLIHTFIFNINQITTVHILGY